MERRLILVTALAAATVWAAGAGTLSLRQWPTASAEIEHARDTGIRGCASRYPEPAARSRCEVLFETQYVMERNIALFTRLLVTLGPLAGAGAWLVFARRRPAGHGRSRP